MVLSLSFYKKVSGRAVRLRTARRDMEEEAPELETEGVLMFMEEENA